MHYNDGTRGGMEETDLHGAEDGAATDKVTRLLSAVSELKMSALKVIYGQGKNSEMGRAKVGPAVREFLAGQNIRFIEAQDGGRSSCRSREKRRARGDGTFRSSTVVYVAKRDRADAFSRYARR